MGDGVIFYGWNRVIPGKEQAGGELFQEFLGYLGGLQGSGVIDSFQPVFLSLHGGDLNGFVMITGEPTKLNELRATDEWLRYVIRAALHLEGVGVVPGVTGDLLSQQMEVWLTTIPA